MRKLLITLTVFFQITRSFGQSNSCPTLDWVVYSTNGFGRVAMAPNGLVYIADITGTIPGYPVIQILGESGPQTYSQPPPPWYLYGYYYSFSGMAVGFSNEVFLAIQTRSITAPFSSVRLIRYPDVILAEFPGAKNQPGSFEALSVEADGGLTYISKIFSDGELVHRAGAESFSFPVAFQAVPVVDIFGDYFSAEVTGQQKLQIVKQGRHGAILWTNQLGGNATFGSAKVATDQDGVYFAGIRGEGETIFGSLKIGGEAGACVAKMDLHGKPLWIKALPKVYLDCIAADPNGGVFIGGRFTTDLDQRGAFIQQYDADGQLLWDGSAIGGPNDYVDSCTPPPIDCLSWADIRPRGRLFCSDLRMPTGVNLALASFRRRTAPALSYSVVTGANGTEVRLMWPLSSAHEGMRLEAAGELGAEFIPVAGQHETNAAAGKVELILPVGESRRFFRLSGP